MRTTPTRNWNSYFGTLDLFLFFSWASLTSSLYRRRKRWEEEKAAATKRTGNFTTIARILKSSNPTDKFQVRARVVGTFPLQLKDCVVRCCKGCSER